RPESSPLTPVYVMWFPRLVRPRLASAGKCAIPVGNGSQTRNKFQNGLDGTLRLRSGHQKHGILRRVFRGWRSGLARTRRSHLVLEITVGGGHDNVDIPSIAARQIGTGTVAARRHHEAETGCGAEREVGRSIRVGRVRRTGNPDRGFNRVRRSIDHGYL